MTGSMTAAAAARDSTPGLPERLRAETAPWHARVEAVIDVPGRVRTRADYVHLLGGLAELHTGLEGQLESPTWVRAWAGVRVDIAGHCRAQLLIADLAELDAPAPGPAGMSAFPSFGHALGCLYVLEGSALGGRLVAGMVRSSLGEVPTAFLTGRGRGRQWPAVRMALRRHAEQGADTDAVVAGAIATFVLFARVLARPAAVTGIAG